MTKANKEHTPTHRPRGKPTAASTPDAALLALCAEFRACLPDIAAWNANALPEGQEDAVHDRWWSAVRAIVATPAVTMAGLRAKAALMPQVVEGVTETPEIDGEFGLSLAADVAALPEPEAPDSELMALLARFEALKWKYLDQFKGDDYPEVDRRRDRLFAKIHAEQEELTEAISSRRPTTLVEFQALARATIIWAPEEVEPFEHHSLHERVGRVLLRSLAGDEWMERLFKVLGRPERRAITVDDVCHAGEWAR